MSLEANKIAAAVLVAPGTKLTLSVGLALQHYLSGTTRRAPVPNMRKAVLAKRALLLRRRLRQLPPDAPHVSAVPLIAAADRGRGREGRSPSARPATPSTSGGPNRVGPNLWGVVGGHSAHKEDFAYSEVIKNLNITWDFEHLDQFLTNPKAYAPGTKMSFAGLKKPGRACRASSAGCAIRRTAPVPLPQ